LVDNPFKDDNKFDKGDLKDELENAGFEDCVADNIADRVNDKKADGWTHNQGREEALREIEMFIDSTRQAYENYRLRAGTTREQVSTTY
jgi:hypothetical protein